MKVIATFCNSLSEEPKNLRILITLLTYVSGTIKTGDSINNWVISMKKEYGL